MSEFIESDEPWEQFRMVENMHHKVETIFSGGVDHIHADMLHKNIDELADIATKTQARLEEAESIITDLLGMLEYTDDRYSERAKDFLSNSHNNSEVE